MARTLIIQKEATNEGGAGQQVFKLDTGLLFHGLHIVNQDPGTPIDIADLLQINYQINGTDYIPASMDGASFDAINQVDGLPAFDGQTLYIPFDLEGFKDQRLRELTGVNTGVVSPVSGKVITNHTLRLKWAVAVNVAVYADVEPATAEGPGVVRRFSPYDKDSVVGMTTLSDFDFASPQFAWWRRLFVKTSAGAVSHAQLSTPRAMIWGEKIPKAAADMALILGSKVPGAFWSYILAFDATGSGYTAVPKVGPTGQLLPDTPNNPMLDTLPLDKTTLKMALWNTVAGSNALWLESVGELE
jgi:hypothetical protein